MLKNLINDINNVTVIKRERRNINALYNNIPSDQRERILNNLKLSSDIEELTKQILVCFIYKSKPPVKLNVTFERFEEYRVFVATLK